MDETKSDAVPSGQTPIPLGDDLTIEHAEALRDLLLTAIDQADAVSLDLGTTRRMDLTGLQILCAAHRTAVEAGKTLRIAETNQRFRDMVGCSGFRHSSECHPDCLWAE